VEELQSSSDVMGFCIFLGSLLKSTAYAIIGSNYYYGGTQRHSWILRQESNRPKVLVAQHLPFGQFEINYGSWA
jgi:hypothetical protein